MSLSDILALLALIGVAACLIWAVVAIVREWNKP
jgi:hypothetical protein